MLVLLLTSSLNSTALCGDSSYGGCLAYALSGRPEGQALAGADSPVAGRRTGRPSVRKTAVR